MPYTMTDEVTGDRFEFDDKFPTDKARDLIMSKRPGAGSKPPFLRGQQGGPTPPPMIEGSIDVSGEDLPTVKDVVSGVMPVVRPTVEGTAAAVGGMVGARRGGVKGALAGAGTLYAGAKGVMDAIEEKIGTKPTPSVVGRVLETGKDYLTGAGIEAGGQTGGKILETGLKVGGKLSKALMGRITGTGTGAVDEALAAGKSTTGTNWFETKSGFDRAMRGDITGDEIVQTAQSAIRNVRLQRATAYQKELEKVGGINRSLDISPVRRKMGELLDRYGLVYTVAEDGERVLKPKFTGSSLNKVDLNKVEEMVDTVMRWGKKKGDRTPVGVDTLKRYLDNFYSDSSAIRQMTASMRSEVNGVLTRNIPEYARMTKGYAEATNLIKDIESGLMLRKQGMSGRVTADQTLRRLVSAMKDNNELRKDLLTV